VRAEKREPSLDHSGHADQKGVSGGILGLQNSATIEIKKWKTSGRKKKGAKSDTWYQGKCRLDWKVGEGKTGSKKSIRKVR